MTDYYVYIMASDNERLLYIGVTSNLKERVQQHKSGKFKGFSCHINLSKCLYYELWDNAEAAVKRQYQLKSWHRQWKFALIHELNPEMVDLLEKEIA